MTTTQVRFVSELSRARAATHELVAPLDDDELARQVSPLMSPLAWDLAHIAWFEELWLSRRVGGMSATDPRFDDLYDAFRHDRAERAALPILPPDQARAYLSDVRRRSLAALAAPVLDDCVRLLRDGYAAGLVAQHELQHQETMLQTLQLTGRAYPTPTHHDDAPAPGPDDVVIPSGPVEIGSRDEPWAYDNELPPHEIELPAFRIERHPVTNARFAAFVEDGGYRTRRFWSDDGWAWLQRERVEAPLAWQRTRGGWFRTRFGTVEPVPPAEPVQHISFHEAEAVAAWAGKRLPTELEWEKAAAGASADDPGANLGRRAFGPLPAGRRAESDSGCCGMLGDVWEWTSSPFAGYPGFEPFPYREYSEVFFGDGYQVLRGGSWATDRLVARVGFRNWDLPERRQIFSGVRLAGDA